MREIHEWRAQSTIKQKFQQPNNWTSEHCGEKKERNAIAIG